MKFSIIVPTWNEGRQISSSLRRLREISKYDDMELIVVDGGSQDGTRKTAQRWADKVLDLGKPNRGAQLHAGAKEATGEFFLFLHADTQPPGDWQERLEQFWLTPHLRAPSATVFSVAYGSHWKYRLVAWGQNTRVDLRQIAYGDAGFCTTRENYEASGGIPEIPLMEDVVFSRRLRRLGRIVRLPGRIHPGARRLHRVGPLLNSLRNFWVRTRFALGASPENLWRAYYSVRHEGPIGLSDGERALKDAVKRSRRA